VDPEPDWIRIQWDPWIRIRNPNPDPDPGGQKLPTKIEKIKCYLLRAQDFSYSLDVRRINKLQFLIKKYITFFRLYFFQFLVIKTLDPEPDQDSLEMLDPDPYPYLLHQDP
jgi:hypothetical protein